MKDDSSHAWTWSISGTPSVFKYGHFISTLLNFIIIALVVFLM